MPSDVTVLIPSYNPGAYLREAVKSVFEQIYDKWKLIIVDDASTDGSLRTIEDYLRDPRVTLIRNPVNLGQSKTQNRGLAAVDTPFMIMLDSDDWYFPHTLEVVVNESKKVPDDVALICGNKVFVFFDEHGNKVKERRREYGFHFDNPYDYLLKNYVPYPRFYRTSALLKVGGWPTDDPYEGRYLEDQRMDTLLLRNHFRIHWINHMLYNYRRHVNNMSGNLKLMNEMIEWNVRDTLKKYGDQYEPVFYYDYGWIKVKELILKKPGK